MKTKLFFFALLLAGFNASAQVKDLSGTYTLDSCLIIVKQFPGWQIADTADIRVLAPTLKGFAYLTRTQYEGNYVEEEIRQPLRKLIANAWVWNGPAYFSLVLVPLKP